MMDCQPITFRFAKDFFIQFYFEEVPYQPYHSKPTAETVTTTASEANATTTTTTTNTKLSETADAYWDEYLYQEFVTRVSTGQC